jgi:hypothetical protein
MTASADAYFGHAKSTLSVFNFVIQTALRSDYVRVVAQDALDGRDVAKDRSFVDVAMNPPGPATGFLRRNGQTLLEMTFCRLVENFEVYLSDILREALKAKPEMLRSSEEVRLDYVLGFETMADMLEDLVDRKIADLSYLGLQKLSDWVHKKMSVPLIEDGPVWDDIAEAIEARNAIVHARGRIGQKYLHNVRNARFQKDEVRILEPDEIFHCAGAFGQVVSRFDGAIATKYGLERRAYAAPAG